MGGINVMALAKDDVRSRNRKCSIKLESSLTVYWKLEGGRKAHSEREGLANVIKIHNFLADQILVLDFWLPAASC